MWPVPGNNARPGIRKALRKAGKQSLLPFGIRRVFPRPGKGVGQPLEGGGVGRAHLEAYGHVLGHFLEVAQDAGPACEHGFYLHVGRKVQAAGSQGAQEVLVACEDQHVRLPLVRMHGHTACGLGGVHKGARAMGPCKRAEGCSVVDGASDVGGVGKDRKARMAFAKGLFP